MTKSYEIAIHSATDSSYIRMELTDEQAEFVRDMANRIMEESRYFDMEIKVWEGKEQNART